MSSVYTQPSISGYNSNPPEDDGSETSTNEVKWSTHVSKIGDPLKTYAQAVDSAVNTAFGKIPFSSLSAISTNTSVTTSDRGKFYAASSSITVTLPAAADATETFTIHVANVGSGTVTIDGDSSETINGLETIDIIPDAGITLITDGSNWYGLLSNNGQTGDIKESFASSLPGYLLLDGSTIGSAASGADFAGAKYQPLYEHIWDNVAQSEAAVTTTGGRGTTAAGDFDADKPLTLPDRRGRVALGKDNMGGSSANVATDSEADTIGDVAGQESVTLAETNIPAHTHGSAGNHSHDFHIAVNDTGNGIDLFRNADNSYHELVEVSSNDDPVVDDAIDSAGGHTHSSFGGGNATDIMNPYMTMNILIRY